MQLFSKYKLRFLCDPLIYLTVTKRNLHAGHKTSYFFNFLPPCLRRFPKFVGFIFMAHGKAVNN